MAPPTVQSAGSLPLADSVDVVTCRQMVRQLAGGLGFSMTGQTMLVTAASELARNAIIHAGGGRFSWEIVAADAKRGIRLTFEDEGPGIQDIHRAMANGWSSGTGLGLGLPGARRLVHDFDIQSTPGKGTRVLITRWQS